MGFLWLLNCFQVSHRLRDHFATTVAHLWASCVLSVTFWFYFFHIPFYNNAAKIFSAKRDFLYNLQNTCRLNCLHVFSKQ